MSRYRYTDRYNMGSGRFDTAATTLINLAIFNPQTTLFHFIFRSW